MVFANSLDPDQDRQNVGPDLDPNFYENVDFEKIQQKTIKVWHSSQHKKS